MRRLSGADDLLGDPLGQIDRDGKTEAGSRGLLDGGVDADHLAGCVDQRPAAVAWIHGCISLDVGHSLPLSDRIGAIHGTDDPRSHGVVEAKGITDRNGPFPWLESIGITKGRDR
ncbi:MAG: Uncharacterised protein [Cyanobium sp. ARS6]|nr:MAG: Uncharacterised protein [Cyanobium sp. ARS6]